MQGKYPPEKFLLNRKTGYPSRAKQGRMLRNTYEDCGKIKV